MSHVNNFLRDDIALVEEYEPKSVLEFGIGDGRFARSYIKNNPNILYVGVDNSKEMLIYAKNSGAILILKDFASYLKYLIHKKIKFDCIVAPYTVIHHTETIQQAELFENMKEVANVIIINSVTQEKEEELFIDNTKKEITFMLSNGKNVKTIIYKLSELIRKNTQRKNMGGHRENLVWTKK